MSEITRAKILETLKHEKRKFPEELYKILKKEVEEWDFDKEYSEEKKQKIEKENEDFKDLCDGWYS